MSALGPFFIDFFRFLPLLSLRQAFEMLYLARKYLIEDLENYTKNFILNNKQTVAGATDVFLYLEMNVKVVYTISGVCRHT